MAYGLGIYARVLGSSRVQSMKFEPDWIMYLGVINLLSFMESDGNFNQMQGVESKRNHMFHLKWLTSCGCGTMMSGGFLVCLGMTNACTEFYLPTQN